MPSSAAASVKFSCRAAASNTLTAARGGNFLMPQNISSAYHLMQAFRWTVRGAHSYFRPSRRAASASSAKGVIKCAILSRPVHGPITATLFRSRWPASSPPPGPRSSGSTPSSSMPRGGAKARADRQLHHHPGRHDMNINDLKFAALAAVMAAAVTGATLVAASPAFGADLVVNAPTARVSYADLDLGSPAGVAKLEHRVSAAADRLCI